MSNNGGGNGHDDEESAPSAPREINNRTLYKILTNLQLVVDTRLSQLRHAVTEAPEPISDALVREVGGGLADVGEQFAAAAIAVKGT